jgi:Xaa-Pro dipeptidase
VINRRAFIESSAAAIGGAALMPSLASSDALHPAIRALAPMTGDVVPISDDERRARMERARKLMVDNGFDAIFIEPGTTMSYFTGVSWGTSERMFAMVLPARGEPAFICPAFEEARAREVIRFSSDVRVWQEDENPGAHVAQVIRDRGLATRRIGIEQRARFFLADLIRTASPAVEQRIADAVTVGCRMIKSPAELALMQKANDITLAAMKATFATMKLGMTQEELRANMAAACRALGAPHQPATPQFGIYTAYPHGSQTPQQLHEGDVVQIDDGVKIEGYGADITRTTVFGKPSARQRQVWDLEKKAQQAALAAAKVGVPCEAIDAAARKVITDAGFGPGYKVPGLPHRTGHGIGMDGHEAPNLVRGNTLPLAPGMCFSDEPMIAIYGEFGIRLEDCWHMTENGAVTFTPLSPSIEVPVA